MPSKTELLEQWYRRVWLEADLDAIDEMFRLEGRATGIMPGMQIGAEEFKELVPMMLDTVDELEINLGKTLEVDDWVSTLFMMRAVCPNTSKPIRVMGSSFVRFREDMIVEAYNNFDYFAFFEQIGLLPENAVALCMAGQPLS